MITTCEYLTMTMTMTWAPPRSQQPPQPVHPSSQVSSQPMSHLVNVPSQHQRHHCHHDGGDEDDYHVDIVDGEGKSMQIWQRCSSLQARLVCDHSLTVKTQGRCRGVSSPCSSHSWHLHRRRTSLIFRPDLNHYNHES